MNRERLAIQWVSYAVGMVIGRFEPGVENGLGRGNFSDDVAGRLRGMADADGMLVMDEGHRDNLPARVMDALNVMLGEEAAADVVKAATGKEGGTEDLLRQYLDRQFFKLHIQQYRKRPVYWFLQSPRKKYGLSVFHERLNKDSLYRIRKEYLEPKIHLSENRIRELIPSWQAEPKKAWEALERGDYDWAYQAMDHWPDRVKEKCKTNKSFAIAHGLV